MKTAGARRKARELALSILFEADIGGAGPGAAMGNADHTITVLMEEWGMAGEERVKLQPEIEHFGRRLADIYFRGSADIDALIQSYSHEWALERMPGIDRNLLRMALAELKHCPDVPVSAAINEAVELAKEYGGPESGKFVNGILGAFARDLDTVTRTMKQPPPTAAPAQLEPVEAVAAEETAPAEEAASSPGQVEAPAEEELSPPPPAEPDAAEGG